MTARPASPLIHRRFILGAALLVAGQAQAGTLTFGDIGSWNTPYEEWEAAVNAFEPTAASCFANQQAPLVARLRFAMGASGKATAVNDITDTIGAAGFERLKDPKAVSCIISAVSNYQWPRYASEEQDLEFFFTPRTSDVWTELWKARPGDLRSSIGVPLERTEEGGREVYRGPDVLLCGVAGKTAYIFDDRDLLVEADLRIALTTLPYASVVAFNACATKVLGSKPQSSIVEPFVLRDAKNEFAGVGMRAKPAPVAPQAAQTAITEPPADGCGTGMWIIQYSEGGPSWDPFHTKAACEAARPELERTMGEVSQCYCAESGGYEFGLYPDFVVKTPTQKRESTSSVVPAESTTVRVAPSAATPSGQATYDTCVPDCESTRRSCERQATADKSSCSRTCPTNGTAASSCRLRCGEEWSKQMQVCSTDEYTCKKRCN